MLVNNAGRGALATAEQLSLDDVRAQLEVNYVGPVALTKLVLPHMAHGVHVSVVEPAAPVLGYTRSWIDRLEN